MRDSVFSVNEKEFILKVRPCKHVRGGCTCLTVRALAAGAA